MGFLKWTYDTTNTSAIILLQKTGNNDAITSHLKQVKGKSNLKKSSVAGRPIDSENEDARDPLTPINFNSPELDTFKTSV